MFKISGSLSDNSLFTSIQLGATLTQLPYQIGCASPFATQVTPLGVFWLSSDKELWLFTDSYAPRNVGRSVQDILNSIPQNMLSKARMAYFKTKDHDLIVLAVCTSGSINNTLLLLDLDLLRSNGQPSFFTFDMATNSPSWWIFKTSCPALGTVFDTGTVDANQHLVTGDLDVIMDSFYDGTSFKVGPELSVPANVTLQWLGNEQPQMVKRMGWIRFVTNQNSLNLQAQGWKFGVDSADDDLYTLASPLHVDLYPGVDSPPAQVALEYGPNIFRFGGIKYAIGRRFRFSAQFPSQPGDFRLRENQTHSTMLYAR